MYMYIPQQVCYNGQGSKLQLTGRQHNKKKCGGKQMLRISHQWVTHHFFRNHLT